MNNELSETFSPVLCMICSSLRPTILYRPFLVGWEVTRSEVANASSPSTFVLITFGRKNSFSCNIYELAQFLSNTIGSWLTTMIGSNWLSS